MIYYIYIYNPIIYLPMAHSQDNHMNSSFKLI